jgi:hypothetical protein
MGSQKTLTFTVPFTDFNGRCQEAEAAIGVWLAEGDFPNVIRVGNMVHTALTFSAKYGVLAGVTAGLERGIDPCIKSHIGTSPQCLPLHYAAMFPNAETASAIATALLAHSTAAAQVTTRDLYGDAPAGTAAAHQNTTVRDECIQINPDPTLQVMHHTPSVAALPLAPFLVPPNALAEVGGVPVEPPGRSRS